MSARLAITPVPEIIYQDKNLLVLNKPAGLHSVRQKGSENFSVAQWLIQKDSSLEQIGNSGDAGLVQRLDFDTSGLLIAAKDNSIWEALHKLIMQGGLKKYYFCLVEGIPEEKNIEIKSFIGSPYRRASKVKVYKKNPGKPHRALAAKTNFSLLSFNKKSKFSLFKAEASTARRHQIRAHAAAIGHPLVGDSLYGAKQILDQYDAGFYLQASFISFLHPLTGKKLEFMLQIPDAIKKMAGTDKTSAVRF